MFTRLVLAAMLALAVAAPARAADVFYDRVKESTTTTGTGNVTLLGAVAGFRTFNSTVGVGPTFPYFIVHRASAEWEAGRAVLSGSATLVRQTVQASSNGGAAVAFSSGTKDVFLSPTAATFSAFLSTLSASDILTLLLTVDGPASGLNADLLDGLSSAAFVQATDYEALDVLALLVTVDGAGSLLDADTLDGLTSTAFVLATDYEDSDVLTKVKNVDGAASGLDADLLDGAEGAAYATDAEVSAGYVALTDYEAADVLAKLLTVDGPASTLDADTLDGVSSAAFATDAEVLAGYVALGDYENADVLAKLILVDGAASGLDADLLDGSSSAAFALVAGGNAFAASNTYAANDITDADVVDTLTCSNYLPLAGGTLTGSVTGTNLTMTGSIDVQNVIRDTASAYLEVDEGGVRTTGPFAVVTQSSGNVNIAPNNTTRFTVYNAGFYGIPSGNQQAITISTGNDTTSPTSSHVELTCTTPPCTYKPGDTSAVDGYVATVCNVDASDNIDIASAAGTVVVHGTPLTLTPGDCASCNYSGDVWGCR